MAATRAAARLEVLQRHLNAEAELSAHPTLAAGCELKERFAQLLPAQQVRLQGAKRNVC